METFISEWDASEDDARAEFLSAVAHSMGESFTPDTPEKAAWVTSRIAFHEAEAARIKAAFAREVKRHERAARFFHEAYASALEAVARRMIDEAGGKRQKAILPNGVALAFRRIPDAIKVVDEESALAWAESNNPDAIRVRREIVSSALKEWFANTGEIAAGCEALRDRVGFYIQTGDQK